MIMSFLKKHKILTVSLILTLTVGLASLLIGNTFGISNGASDPGGDDDPVVSQSMLDSKIEVVTKLVQSYGQKIEDLTKTSQGSTQGTVQKFEVVEVKLAKSVICGESTEIILRSGKAKAISSDAGGLADITSDSGTDLKSGANIPTNHLLLVPRDDGRGIKILSASAWVMIKGKYEIK